MIRIKSKKAGFRRCGVAHADQWTEYPDARFSADQVTTLKAEPMLSVEIVKNPAAHTDKEPPKEPASPAPGKAAETGKDPVKPGKKGKK